MISFGPYIDGTGKDRRTFERRVPNPLNQENPLIQVGELVYNQRKEEQERCRPSTATKPRGFGFNDSSR